METLFQILIVLLVARLFGELAQRLGQAVSVGELLAGIALALAALYLGPWIGVLDGLAESPELKLLADIGIFVLVLMAGVEMEPKEIAENSSGGLLVALGGMFVPLLAGCAFGWLLLPDGPLKLAQALVIGVAMAITAIPATVKVLSEFDMLHTRLGETIVAAALFDDVLGLVLLAVLTAVIQTGEVPDLETLLWLLGKVAAFFAITIALGVHVYPRISRRLREMQAVALELSALVIAALAYGILADFLDMHWILGAFMAGLFFEAARLGETVYRDVKLTITAVAGGVLGPFFFVFIGLRVEFATLAAVPLEVGALIVLAFAGKLIGAAVPARLIGFSRGAALAIGTGMTSRGAVALIVLGVTYDAGLFTVVGSGTGGLVDHLFSALVIMALANTFLMPVVLRTLLRRHGPGGAAD